LYDAVRAIWDAIVYRKYGEKREKNARKETFRPVERNEGTDAPGIRAAIHGSNGTPKT
jgi:hypothetical protein